MAKPATDLTINSVIAFERVWTGKGHDRNGSDTTVFWGWFPSGLCKNKVLLIFFLPQLHNIKQNDSLKRLELCSLTCLYYATLTFDSLNILTSIFCILHNIAHTVSCLYANLKHIFPWQFLLDRRLEGGIFSSLETEPCLFNSFSSAKLFKTRQSHSNKGRKHRLSSNYQPVSETIE